MKLWKQQPKTDVNIITKNKVLNEASRIFISKLDPLKLSFGFSFQINTEIKI